MLTSKCLEEFQSCGAELRLEALSPVAESRVGGGEEEGGWGGGPEGLDISRNNETQRSFESQQQNIKIDTGVTREPRSCGGAVDDVRGWFWTSRRSILITFKQDDDAQHIVQQVSELDVWLKAAHNIWYSGFFGLD